MKTKIIILLSFITTQLFCSTPTERYLDKHPIEEIIQYYEGNGDNENYPISKFLSFFYEVINEEEIDGFFGYHASTTKFRIFQDILTVTREEIFGEHLPENFYYFRIPGDPIYNLSAGKSTFLQKHLSVEPSLEVKRKAIQTFILEPLNIYTFDDKDVDVYWAYFYGIRKLLHDDMTQLKKKFKFRLNDTQSLIQTLISQKKMGFVTTRTNEVLLPIITTIAEIHHHHPSEFQKVLSYDNFLYRVWGCDDYQLASSVYRFFQPIWDTYGEQQSQLMAVNIALFGNYLRWDESSVSIFFDNETIESGDRMLKDLLRNYYEEIGLDPNLVNQLWNIAANKLKKAKVNTGVLYQLYHVGDLNHDAFASVDFGVPVDNIEPTEAVASERLLVNKYNVDLQLRLVMSNDFTLDPQGGLRAIRYDNTPPKISAEILDEMRTKLRKARKTATL